VTRRFPIIPNGTVKTTIDVLFHTLIAVIATIASQPVYQITGIEFTMHYPLYIHPRLSFIYDLFRIDWHVSDTSMTT
jgi:hypothetical protein